MPTTPARCPDCHTDSARPHCTSTTCRWNTCTCGTTYNRGNPRLNYNNRKPKTDAPGI